MGNKINHAAQVLREAGIEFQAINHGSQLLVEPKGRRIAFWPTSGKFYAPNKGNPPPTSHLNGVDALIKYLKGV